MNESLLLKSFMGNHEDYPNPKRKIDWLRENSKITGDEYLVVDRARALRNKILHGNKQAYLSDGLRLLEAHNILQKIQSS